MKQDFPIFTTLADLIYLDSAATSQKPDHVLKAIETFYKSYNANIHRGLYPIAEQASTAVEMVREKVRGFINAQFSQEIIFTKSATESSNLLAYSLGKTFFKKDDVIVTTIMEHHANFVPWQQIAIQNNAEFIVIDCDESGFIELEKYTENLKKAKVFTFSYISNVLGVINPVKAIIQEVRKINKDILIVIDASQAAPHLPLDVEDIDCDFLFFTGHKMFSETGVGVLYGKKKYLERMTPFLYGGDMIKEVNLQQSTFADLPSKFEAGTLHISGIISLGAAIEYIESIGFTKIQKHEQMLLNYLLSKLENLDGLTLLGTTDMSKKIGILSFSFDRIHPHDIAQLLAEKNICVRAGHHCAMPLHTKFNMSATTRVSLSVYNTKNDIDIFVKRLLEIPTLLTR